MTLDSISGLCKRHQSSWWLAHVTIPKLCRVWAQGVIIQPLLGYVPFASKTDQVQRLGPPLLTT